jgi:opacity protein-like surface antigen
MAVDILADAGLTAVRVRARTERIAMVSGRVGVAVTPEIQVYGRLGYSSMEYRWDTEGLFGFLDGGQYGEVQAWVTGCGLQVAITSEWAIRCEYAHLDFERVEEVEDGWLRFALEPHIDTFTFGVARVY